MPLHYDEGMGLPQFLRLPPRSQKPRRSGLTHVLDRGLPVAFVEAQLETVKPYTDVWKFGWGTAYVDPGVPRKVAACRRHDVRSCVGGTLLEAAWLQNAAGAFLDWAATTGFDSVEVSNGVAEMPPKAKRLLIEQAGERFVVLSEVGSKNPEAAVEPAAWADEAAEDLHAGARWVVAEGRESGEAGLYRADQSVRAEVARALVERVGLERLIFEAPQRGQQSWLLQHFGARTNLGNIPADGVLGLETLRLGLRADTLPAMLPVDDRRRA